MYRFSSEELNSTARGFGGDVDVEILVDSELRIVNLEIIAPHESPGYLEKVKNWSRKLEGQKLDYFLEPEEIDTVTGATITADAALRALEDTARKAKGMEDELERPGEKPGFSGIGPGLVLIMFTAVSIFLFHYKPSLMVRYIYLLTLLFLAGFYFNLQYSYSQLWGLLNLQLPSFYRLERLVLFFLPFVIGIFYGRFYCGWLCPFGALQELISFKKISYRPPRFIENYLNWFRFVLLAAVAGGSYYFATNIYRVDPLEEAFIFWNTSWLHSILLLLAVVGSLFIFRFWCRYFCPVGAVFSLLNKIALFSWIFKKKFGFCDQGERSLRGLRCTHCQRCFPKE